MITSIKIANFKIAQLEQELAAEREKVKELTERLAAAQATIAEMREELAKQEPVAWMNPHGGVLQRLDTGIERETYTIPLYAAPVVQPDIVQKLRDILQMLLQEPDTKAALFKAEDMLREVIAAAQESNAKVSDAGTASDGLPGWQAKRKTE